MGLILDAFIGSVPFKQKDLHTNSNVCCLILISFVPPQDESL